jgi:hypothetical protein
MQLKIFRNFHLKELFQGCFQVLSSRLLDSRLHFVDQNTDFFNLARDLMKNVFLDFNSTAFRRTKFVTKFIAIRFAAG